MNALWWWIDRWRKSTAYTDMTLEQQGAYRNLLDEATLRGGAIPSDERILAKASGDATAWRRLRGVVLARFELHDDGWHNATLDNVIHQSERRAKKQKNYRDRRGNGGGNGGGNDTSQNAGNEPGNKPGSPDPDLSVPPSKNDGGSALRPREASTHTARALITPVIPRGQSLAWDRQQQAQHAGCLPEFCVRFGTAPRKCMTDGVLRHLAGSVGGMTPDAARRFVLDWAKKDEPPSGWHGPAKEFAYWTERWDTTRPRPAEKPDRRADHHFEMVERIKRGEYDR